MLVAWSASAASGMLGARVGVSSAPPARAALASSLAAAIALRLLGAPSAVLPACGTQPQHEMSLSAGGATPGSVTTGTQFTFSAAYTDSRDALVRLPPVRSQSGGQRTELCAPDACQSASAMACR